MGKLKHSQPKHKTLDGNGRQPCCRLSCPFRSIAGHRKGNGLCPFHWNEYANGLPWAEKCHPTFREERDKRIREQGF